MKKLVVANVGAATADASAITGQHASH